MNLGSTDATQGAGKMTISIPTPRAGDLDPIATPPPAAPEAAQVAALCWRMHKGRVQVLLVTSRDTGRWVLPKGWPMAGKTADAAAEREAWEEAGVEGLVQALPVGRYCYDKIRPDATVLRCCVEIFPLRVRRLKSEFPEHKERRRKWFSAGEAASLVAEAELGDLLRRLDETPALLTGMSKSAMPSV